MSIDSKRTLMNDLQKILSDVVTANQLTEIMCKFGDDLSHYDVERKAEDNTVYEFQEMLDTYIAAKVIEGRSPSTLERYRYIIAKFCKETPIPIRDVTVFTVRNYLAKEKERGLSDRTLEGYRQIFSAFFKWLHNEGLLVADPCSNLAPVKYQKKVYLPYSSVDLEYIKENCQCSRDKAIVHFLLSTGCRVSEMCSLNKSDVNFQTLECKVLGKGNKERIVYLDEVAGMYLERYLSERTDDSEALFSGRGIDRLTTQGIRCVLLRIAERAEVNKVHPHRFRRTLATNMIGRGMDIQDVKSILGHENIETTMGYVYIDKNNVKNAYRKYA